MSNVTKYKKTFNEILLKHGWWSRIAGSQFVDMLTTFVGQLVDKTIFAGYRYLQETFTSTAVKRSSILAQAEDKAYVGRKRMPSMGKVRVINLTSRLMSIPRNAPLISKAGIQYVVTNAIEIPANESVDIAISQLVLKRMTYNVEVSKKFLTILLSKEDTQIAHRVDVFVTTQSGASDLWEKRYQFRRAGSRDKVYAELYKPTEQLGIMFGNGINGLIPSAGTTVTLDVWTTSGDTMLIDNQSLEFITSATHLNNSLQVKTITPITGGAEAESDEETRAGVLFITPYDNQLVWDGDYAHYIKSNLANIIWIKAWGEQQQEEQDGKGRNFNYINNVFISAFSSKLDQTALEEIIKKFLNDTKEFNKIYTYVEPVETPFKLHITGVVTGDKDFLMVKKAVCDAISEVYGRIPSKMRPTDILKKDVNDLVSKLNIFHDFSINWDQFPAHSNLEDYVFINIDNDDFTLKYLEM